MLGRLKNSADLCADDARDLSAIFQAECQWQPHVDDACKNAVGRGHRCRLCETPTVVAASKACGLRAAEPFQFYTAGCATLQYVLDFGLIPIEQQELE